MSIGVSIFLMAVGAILAWGVNFEPTGIDLDVVGLILVVMGFVGLLLSLLFWSSFAPFARREQVIRSDVVVDEPETHHHHTSTVR